MSSFVYIASPLTSKSPALTDDENAQLEYDRYLAALRVSAYYANRGQIVFSPVVNSYWMYINHSLPGEWQYWEKFDRAFLESASALWILAIDGWRESVGIKAEVSIAKELGLPLFMVTENGVGNYYRDEYSYEQFERAVKS